MMMQNRKTASLIKALPAAGYRLFGGCVSRWYGYVWLLGKCV